MSTISMPASRRMRIGLAFVVFGLLALAYLSPMIWMVLLTLYTFAETHLSSWATFISLGNRLPFLPVTVLTNVASVGLSLVLLKFTSLGFGALVLGPLLAGAAHNYWRWPREGCRVLETSWTRLFFSGKNV